MKVNLSAKGNHLPAGFACLQPAPYRWDSLYAFRKERDWLQFHDPKNLAEALSIEGWELLKNFLWKTTEQSHNLTNEELANVKNEIAVIFIFLTFLCEEYDINLLHEVERKLLLNEEKYPVQKAKCSASC